jgi:hypothetical protein
VKSRSEVRLRTGRDDGTLRRAAKLGSPRRESEESCRIVATGDGNPRRRQEASICFRGTILLQSQTIFVDVLFSRGLLANVSKLVEEFKCKSYEHH